MGEDQVDSVRRVSRRLRDLVEPLAANVYFAPEARAAYQHLGIEDYGAGYFTSRGACLGHVPGHVVAAAFGVFNPDVVVPAVAEGWSKTDVGSILAAREQGAVASLERILSWDFDRVVVAHGDVLEHGGRDALRHGYRWLLAA